MGRRESVLRGTGFAGAVVGAVLVFSVAAVGQKIFDGKKKVVLRTHDSVDGGAFLQDRLARYNGGDAALMPVFAPGSSRGSGVDTVKGGGFIYKTDAGSKDEWLPNAKSYISSSRSGAGCADCPVVFFVQATYDPIVVVDTNDAAQVDKAVRLMKFVCDEVKKAGATWVFFATLHYQYAHRAFAENEPYVVREFNRRFSDTTNFRAVDAVTPTLKGWPLSSCGDKRHPTGYGKTIMSDAYFRAMLEFDGIKEVPSWSAEMIETERLEWQKGRDWADKYVHLPPPGRYKIGDTLTVRWDADLCKYSTGQYSDILVALQFSRKDRTQLGGIGHFIQIEELGGKRFTSGAAGQSSRADCDGPQNYMAKIPVTESLFSSFGPFKNVPIPLIVNVSFHQVYQYHWKGADSDLSKANEYIFYPSRTINASLPVYPNVNTDGSPVGVATPNRAIHRSAIRVLAAREAVTVTGLPTTGAKICVYDISGRLHASRAWGGGMGSARIAFPTRMGVVHVTAADGSRFTAPIAACR